MKRMQVPKMYEKRVLRRIFGTNRFVEIENGGS
jgi:hypothetical protein